MHTHRTSRGSLASSRLPRARPRAPPARSSPGSARRRDPDARIHPCPLASLPRHGSLARAFHRRDAFARVRSDASREQSPVHLSRARRFPRVIVTLVRTRWMHDSRARRRTGSNANARRTSSDARKVRARAHPRDRRRRRHARRRARVCRRARMGARRRGDEDDRLTVYAHECMWMTSIVVFISDVWNILSSYICFL